MKIIVLGGDGLGSVPMGRILKRYYEIIGVAVREDNFLKVFADEVYMVKDAVNDTINIAKKKGAKVIFPVFLKKFEKHIGNRVTEFKKTGKEFIYFGENYDIADDKLKVLELYESLGMNPGKYTLVESEEDLYKFANEVGFPFVLKPRVSRFSIGVKVVRSKNDLESVTDFPLVATEYVEGLEYTVDIYRSPITGESFAVPRRVDKMLYGITLLGVVEKNEELIDASKKLADALGGRYCFSFQFKKRSDGKYILIDCNPRLEGTMLFSILAGANFLKWCVQEAHGERVDFSSAKIKWGMMYRTFLDGVGFYNGETILAE